MTSHRCKYGDAPGANFALSGVEIAEHAKPEIRGGSIPLGRMVTLPFRARGQTCLRGQKPDSRGGDRPECNNLQVTSNRNGFAAGWKEVPREPESAILVHGSRSASWIIDPACIYFDGSMSAQWQREALWWNMRPTDPECYRVIGRFGFDSRPSSTFTSGSPEERAETEPCDRAAKPAQPTLVFVVRRSRYPTRPAGKF